MSIERVVEGIAGFGDWKHAERIRFFAWYLHRYEEKPRFDIADIRRLYTDLAMAGPGNYSQQVADLQKSGVLLKDSGGFYLERRVRDEFDKQYGGRPQRIVIHKLLSMLPDRVPNVAERVFLKEALDCYTVEAFRATVVMAWNLAYDHLCSYILARHLVAFNERWPVRFPDHHKKAKVKTITNADDFADMKESQVIEICASARIISGDVQVVLEQALERRNSAAHPSGVAIGQSLAETVVEDLVNNVVLKLVV